MANLFFSEGDAVEFRDLLEGWLPATFDRLGERNGEQVALVTLEDGRSKWGYPDQVRARRVSR